MDVAVGVEAVLTLEGRVKEELPKADLAAIKRMPELALAVVYAASQVSDTRSVGASAG